MYWNITLQVLVEVPCSVLAYFMIESKTYGRRISMLVSFIICSFACFAIFILQRRFFFELLALVKGSANLAFIIVYPYTSELYSTLIRGTASAFLSMICRIGGIIMPWVINYMFEFGLYFPFLSMALISGISAVSNYLLTHDTACQRLDQSFETKTGGEPEDEILIK